MNEIFALKTMEAVRKMNRDRLCHPGPPGPSPIVWIHDYHLMLASNTIR